jgi:WD40 repeat protein
MTSDTFLSVSFSPRPAMRTARLLASACAWLSLCASLPAAAPPAEPPGGPLPKGAIARLGYARMIASDVSSLSLSPDGRLAVCGGECFDLVSGRKKPAPVPVPDGYVLHRLFPAGSYVVRGKDDYALHRPAERPLHFAAAKQDLDRIEFDGRGRLACYVDGEKGRVLLADLGKKGPVEWRLLATLGQMLKPGHEVHLSASGRLVWYDAVKDVLSAHDVASGKTTVLDAKCKACRALAISPDGKRAVAVIYPGEVRIFDVGAGKLLRRVSIGDRIHADGGWFTPDGKAVLLRQWDRYVVVPVERGDPSGLVSVQDGWDAAPFKVQYAPLPDSKRLVTVDSGGVIRVHDLKTGKQLDAHSRFPAFAGVQMLDGHRAASWGRFGTVVVWDVRDGRVLSEAVVKGVREEGEPLGGMEVSRDGLYVAAWPDEEARRQNTVLAEAATGKALEELDNFVTFHPSGKNAVAYPRTKEGEERRCLWYDLTRREWGRRVELYVGENTFSQDGRTILHARGSSVSLTEVASGKDRWTATLPKYKKNQELLAILARKGRRAVVVRQRDAAVLDGLTGRLLAHVHFRFPEDEPVGRAAVSASGRWLAMMDPDTGQLSLYDLDAARPTAIVVKDLPIWAIEGLALDADGSRLITAHGDGTCLVWDLKKFLPPSAKGKAADLWELLASDDPEEVQRAVVALAKDESKAVALFARRLAPAVEVSAKRIAAWVIDLDSEDFDRRTTAERRLTEAGAQAEERLRQAVRKPASVEQKRRAERLLRLLDPKNDPIHLRHLRALEMLERVGSEEAAALLRRLARGAPAARLTREARESLERLKRSEQP